MFKKLRIKFIAITMVMVALVMALAFSAVCAIEFQRSYSVVQTALSDAVNQASADAMRFDGRQGATQDGAFNDMRPIRDFRDGGVMEPMSSSSASSSGFAMSAGTATSSGSATPSGSAMSRGSAMSSSSAAYAENQAATASDASDASDANTGDNTASESSASEGSATESASTASALDQSGAPPFIGNRNGRERSSSSLIPVAVYESQPNVDTHVVPQVTTASISEDVLSEALELVQESGEGFGTLGNLGLHYYKAEREGRTFFVFADTSYTDSWKTLALVLALVGVATLAVFFVITLFYSRWALKPVREAWDSQRQFVADASHDLKTPITVVLANAAILLKHPERTIASESQWIESTQQEAENMQGLVNEMLELAQVEAGEQVHVEKERLDFSDLVEGETLMFDALALERNCAFDCDIEPGIGVYGNEKQVSKMVSTLVENAFKYVDAGGQVSVNLSAKGKNALLSIRNTGSVISAADLPHIFDRFYRTDKARTSGEGGFGLGLAIAREIARQHDGDITCTSNETEGTIFTVSLPKA